MMEPLSFIIGEKRRIALFENTNEAMPPPEAPKTEQPKKMESPDQGSKESSEQMEKTMDEMNRRIDESEKFSQVARKQLTLPEEFKKGFGGRNSAVNDAGDAMAIALEDGVDAGEGSADIPIGNNLPKIGRTPAPNETPDSARTEAGTEARPADRTTEAEGVERAKVDVALKTEQADVPAENSEGNKPR